MSFRVGLQPFAFALLTALLVNAGPARADLPGTADPPGLKRFAGSSIVFQSRADYDRLKFALEKIVFSGAMGAVQPYRSQTVEGRRITTYYRLPERVAPLEALRNYETELKESGFEILFSGLGEEIETLGYNNQIAHEILDMKGTYSTPEERAQWPFQNARENTAAYLAARGKSPEGDERFVSAYFVVNTDDWEVTRGSGRIPTGITLGRVDVIDVKTRQQRLELVTSSELDQAISRDGRIALYGILFAYDSDQIEAAAEPTLAEIAKLMRERADLSILVVGHTDATGSFDYNLGLSRRRAEAVVNRLVQLGIEQRRLYPVGVGFSAPVASNATDEGRAKNRRVELVDLAGGRLP
ncbi:OmpA family protein [Synechococcus sp. H55.2]|uniref:OmpA family protein n=1 Tax=unclassified Synechococcus TaxID=2626047 RepID=UPI0039C33420